MSHPDPTYYHPSSCDCMGCEDRKGSAAAAAAGIAAVGGAVCAAHAVAPVVAPVVAVAAPVVAVAAVAAAVPFLAVSGIKYAINNHKNKGLIKKLHADTICDYKKKIHEAIFDLNKILHNRPLPNHRNKPKPPVGPFFYTVGGFSIILSIVLVVCGLPLFLIPIAAILAVYAYHENQPHRIPIYKKYKEDKAQYDKDKAEYDAKFKKQFEDFMSILEPAKTKVENFIKEFEKWYNSNGYESTTAFNKKVCLQLKGPSTWTMKTFNKVDEYHFKYYMDQEPKVSSIGHEIWNPKD